MMGPVEPSQPGNGWLIPAPKALTNKLNKIMASNDCLSTERAAWLSPAPMWWATCTENPVATVVQMPQKSQVVVATRPMDAESAAPNCPTMEASMYCMTMLDSCEMIAGILSLAVRWNCCLNDMGS